MKEPTIITATDASRGFSELLSKVAYQGDSFVIKKGNRVMARIVPVNEQGSEVRGQRSEARHGEEPKATTRPSKPEGRSGEPSYVPPQKEKSGSPRLQEQPQGDEPPSTIHQSPTTNSDYISQVAAAMNQMLAD